MATELYERNIVNNQGPHKELLLEVWSKTPWMIDVFTDHVDSDQYRDMKEWCQKHFGNEARPLHGKSGRWLRGLATVHGFTWFGFSTEAEMTQFQAAWE